MFLRQTYEDEPDAIMKPSILQDLDRSHQQGGWETGPISMSAPSPLSLPTLILWFANYFEVRECLGSAFWFNFTSPLHSTFLKGHVTQRIRGRPGISSFPADTYVSELSPLLISPRLSPTQPPSLAQFTGNLCSSEAGFGFVPRTRQKENAF